MTNETTNRRKSTLKLAETIQKIVKRYGKFGKGVEGGHSQEWIFENIVYPQHEISRSTFYNLMAIDVRYERKNLIKQPLNPLNGT